MKSLPSDHPPAINEPDAPDSAGHKRLWTPWRMRYVGGGESEPGCVFCNRLAAAQDVRSLILHRGPRVFVIMNLFPYNTGHTMIVPNEHTPSPEAASEACVAEMSRLRRPLLRALRRTLSCHGFNLGMNIGAEAGAGIAEHLHEHVVPRWTGDANFMPILMNTTVMPELIPITYAKVRAELARELTGTADVRCLILTQSDRLVLVDAAGTIPCLVARENIPIWKSAATTLGDLIGTDLDLTGWAGGSDASDATIGFSFRIAGSAAPQSSIPPGWRWIATAEAIAGSDGELVANALSNQSA